MRKFPLQQQQNPNLQSFIQGEQTEEKGDAEKIDEAAEKKDEATEAPKESPATDEAKTDSAEPTETAKPSENGDGTEAEQTLNESKDAVEGADDANTTATPADGKKKKEKSKKRFLSFRSFSFSKKDKSKPKKEENAADTTNGEIEKVPEEVRAAILYISISTSFSEFTSHSCFSYIIKRVRRIMAVNEQNHHEYEQKK